MAIPRIFVSCLCGLWLVSAPQAAFERPVFPLPPLDATFRPTINPATLADVQGLCGDIRHDRPFGLTALAGHGLLLAAPLSPRVSVGLGVARRGADRHRESVAWMGLGIRPLPPVSIGIALRRLAWRGVTQSGGADVAISAGGRLTLSASWSLSGSMQMASAVSPARLSLRLLKQDAGGALAGDFSARGGRQSIPSASMAARLDRRLTLSGQIRSLASAFGAGATLHGAIDLHVRMNSHAVLGPSWSGWLGSSCRRQ